MGRRVIIALMIVIGILILTLSRGRMDHTVSTLTPGVKMKKLNTSQFANFWGAATWDKVPLDTTEPLPNTPQACVLFRVGTAGGKSLWPATVQSKGIVFGSRPTASTADSYFGGADVFPDPNATITDPNNVSAIHLGNAYVQYNKVDGEYQRLLVYQPTDVWGSPVGPSESIGAFSVAEPPPVDPNGYVYPGGHSGRPERVASADSRVDPNVAYVYVSPETNWTEYGEKYYGPVSTTVAYGWSRDPFGANPGWKVKQIWTGKRAESYVGVPTAGPKGTLYLPYSVLKYLTLPGQATVVQRSELYIGILSGSAVTKTRALLSKQMVVPAFGHVGFLEDHNGAKASRPDNGERALFYQYQNAGRKHCQFERYGSQFFVMLTTNGVKSGDPKEIPVPFWAHKQDPNGEYIVWGWNEQVTHPIAIDDNRYLCLLVRSLVLEPKKRISDGSSGGPQHTDAQLQALVFDTERLTVSVAAKLSLALREGDYLENPEVIPVSGKYLFYVEKRNLLDFKLPREAYTGIAAVQ